MQSKDNRKRQLQEQKRKAYWYYKLTNTPVSTIQARRVELNEVQLKTFTNVT